MIPPGDTLPNWRCEAFLKSQYRFEDDDDGSTLAVCWFVEELGDSMEELVRGVIEKLEWKERARRFSHEWF